MQRGVIILSLVGVAVVCALVTSRVVPQRDLPPLAIRHPAPPFAGIQVGLGLASSPLLLQVRPEYPWELRRLGHQVVRLRCRILEDGTVGEITHQQGPMELLPYARAAAAQWRYQPVRLPYSPQTGRREAVSFITFIDITSDPEGSHPGHVASGENRGGNVQIT